MTTERPAARRVHCSTQPERPIDRRPRQRRGDVRREGVGEAYTLLAPEIEAQRYAVLRARVDRSANILGHETLAAEGHRGTLGSDASMRDAEFRRARVVNTS